MISPATLQQTIEAALVAALGVLAPAWQLSRLTWHQFPGADPLGVEALSYAVGLASSEALPPGRQSRHALHAPVTTVVGLRYTSRLRPDAAVEDYRLALDREALLMHHCCKIQGAPLTFRDAVRGVVGDGTVYLGDLRFDCHHYYPI